MRPHVMMCPLALVGSVTVHLLAAGFSPAASVPQVAGGAVAGTVALGSSFADLVAGVATPVTTPVSGAVSGAAPTAVLVAPRPKVTPAVGPVPPEPAAIPVASVTAAAAPPHAVVKAVDAAKPETRALRAATAPQRGNAGQTAAAGRLDGQAQGQAMARSETRESPAAQVGGKEMKRYHAQVLRRIDRTPKRAAGAKGATLVGLGIAADGGIAMLTVLQSSGSDTVDQLALDQVRRAGPFDPTPTAAQINLSLKVESKG